LFLVLSLLAFVSGCLPQQSGAQTGFSAELLGVQLLRDADFYGNRDWVHTRSLPRHESGGRLQVSFKNTSSVTVRLTELSINGRTFAQFTSQPASRPDVADTRWWRTWPNPVPPGKMATLTLRLVDLARDLPANAALELRTDRGTQRFDPPQFNPQPAALHIVSINFSPDLNRTTLFVANQGTREISLKYSGGLSINGNPEYTSGVSVGQVLLAPGDVAPIVVQGTASTLTQGEQAFFRVVAQSGEVAVSSLRVFPYQFAVHSQMQGEGFDPIDRDRRSVGDWRPVAQSLLDEPMSKSLSPMQVVQDVDEWLTGAKVPADQRAATSAIRQQQMVEIHNTGYAEGLIYDDIADIASTHWGDVRQDLSTFLTAPKPNWYMPQNSWGQNEGLYERERWYPLEDLKFQAYQGVGRGAKGIQWFLYQNHWEQGWGRLSGTDFARLYQDNYRSGHIGNPLMWNAIGRISGVLQLLQPYLTDSAPFSQQLQNGIEVDTLVSLNQQAPGLHRAIAVIVDGRTPRNVHAGFWFRYGVPDFAQQVLHNQQIRLRLPTYVAKIVTTAYLIDPHQGVVEVPLRRTQAEQFEFTLPELNTAALLLLGTPADRAPLQQAWERLRDKLATFGDARATLESQAHGQPQSAWAMPTYTYRQSVTVTNAGQRAATTLRLPLDMPLERQFQANDFYVVEGGASQNQSVPFFVQGQQAFERFDRADTLSRVRGDCSEAASPAGCAFRIEHANNVLTLVSDTSKRPATWFLDFANPQPGLANSTDTTIPAYFSTMQVEARIGTFPFARQIGVMVSFDPDGDGRTDKSRPFFFFDDADVVQHLGDGWHRYTIDLQRFFNHPSLYPNELLRGRYTIRLLTQIPPDSPVSGSYAWSIRQISLSGGDHVNVTAATPLAPGESRTYKVYFNQLENSANRPSLQFTPELAGASVALNMTSKPTPLEVAGVELRVENASTLAITTQAEPAQLLVRHIALDGTVVAAYTPALNNRSANVALSRSLVVGEMLAVISIQRNGEGHMFLFNHLGVALSGRVPRANVLRADWIQALLEWRGDGKEVAPFSMQMSSDGQHVAVGVARVSDQRTTTAGLVRLLDARGQTLWEKTYPGRVFYVRFAPDGRSLYVAANLSPDGGTFQMYTNSHIVKYDLNGTEQWRHKVGSGTSLPADRQGRTVFDMQVYPNGDLLYSEWNTFAVRLNGTNGRLVWSHDIASGTAAYISRVVPLADGGAVLVSSSTRCLNPQGQVVTNVTVGRETPLAAAATANCNRWAFAGTAVRVVSKTGELRMDNPGQPSYVGSGSYLGRYPRTMAYSANGQLLAVGTTDGIATLMDNNGRTIWQKRDSSSYVTQIAFLPGDRGVVFAREIFNYRQDEALAAESNGWRFRDVVEAYDLQGNPLWRHEGPWRTNEPFMTQFALDQGGTRLAVMSNSELRYVNLASTMVANDYLYPVEDAPLVEPPIVAPPPLDDGFQLFLPLVRRAMR
jgi:hypothetical protein